MKRWTSSFLALALAPLCLLPIHQASGQNTAHPQANQDQPSSSDVPDTITLREGTVISVRIADKINSSYENRGIDGTDEDDSCLIVTGICPVCDAKGNDRTFPKSDGIGHIR